MAGIDPYKTVEKDKGLFLKKTTKVSKNKKIIKENIPKVTERTISTLGKTPSQIECEKLQAEKRRKDVIKNAKKTHKEKVTDFNEKLAKLSEHYDIPKVGPG